MAEATDISRGLEGVDPIRQRVENSQSATVYVPVEEMAGYDPEKPREESLPEEHRKTLALEHGIQAVYDVVRHAWAFTRGVPEETIAGMRGEEPATGGSPFADLPSATDVLPPGAPVPEVVEAGPDEVTPRIAAAQAANPPTVAVEGTPQRVNPVEAVPVAVDRAQQPENVQGGGEHLPAEEQQERARQGAAPETPEGTQPVHSPENPAEQQANEPLQPTGPTGQPTPQPTPTQNQSQPPELGGSF